MWTHGTGGILECGNGGGGVTQTGTLPVSYIILSLLLGYRDPTEPEGIKRSYRIQTQQVTLDDMAEGFYLRLLIHLNYLVIFSRT